MSTLTEAGMRVAAGRLGLPLEAYRARVAEGLKWCCGHRGWEPREKFYPVWYRADRLSTLCREADRELARERMRRLRRARSRLTAGMEDC